PKTVERPLEMAPARRRPGGQFQMTELLDKLIAATTIGMNASLWASQKGDQIAVWDPIGTRTFKQINEAANRVARLLRDHGLKSGDAVALMCSNRAEFLEVMNATLRCGLRITPVNWHLGTDEVEYIINDCDAK